MYLKVWCGLLLIACAHQAFAQTSALRQAQARMAKGKWASAKQNLSKALSKDSVNTETHYWMATYYFSPANPEYNLDSAYLHVRQSAALYVQTSPRDRDRLQRIPLDSAILHRFREQIDSAAFEVAKKLNTENAYISFLGRFSDAKQRSNAIALRNEVAFLEALRENTTEAYQAYLRKYPDSQRAAEASLRYDQLMFVERTKNGKLASYERFLQEFPQSVFKDSLERLIFHIATAPGLPEDYQQFLEKYPTSKWAPRAATLLFHIQQSLGLPVSGHLLNDSLNSLSVMEKGYWVPFLKNGQYGFMNEEGREMIPPRFAYISENYLCGNVEDDFFLATGGLYSRSGVRIFSDSVVGARNLGMGFLSVATRDCEQAVSKAGFVLGHGCPKNMRLVSNRFVALEYEQGWGLFALNGLQLLPFAYQNIFPIDGVVVLTRAGKQVLVLPENLGALADKNPLADDLVFDEVKAWGGGDIWVRNGVLEGVVDQRLEFVIPFDRHRLTKTSFGFLQEKENRIRIVGASAQLESQRFDRVKELGEWLELYNVPQRSLYQVSTGKIIDQQLDTIWFSNRIIFARKGDSLMTYGRSGKLASFHRSAPLQFISSRDTTAYFFVPEKKKKSVFDVTTGQKLFTADFDEIEYIGTNTFLFTLNKKKGLLNRTGKIILPATYNIIVYASDGSLSLYKDKRFGHFYLPTQKLIKPEYERNLQPYGPSHYIAYKAGGYGLITSDEKAVSPFEFEEIRYWNDTSMLVRKNHHWSIYSWASSTTHLDRIRQFRTLSTHSEETLLTIQRENYYGVISNVRGIVIPPNFTDIVNVGSEEKPLYFTEKRVEEADIYVVIYYNHQGALIRKQVYEADEYERIYCDSN